MRPSDKCETFLAAQTQRESDTSSSLSGHAFRQTRRYCTLRRTTAEGFGKGFFAQRAKKANYALRQKKKPFLQFWPVLGHYWCSVVTLAPFNDNLIVTLKRIQKA